MYSISESVLYFDDFLIYFALALALLVLFTWVYMRFTPHQELDLIRQGNTAAAISLGGSILGFTAPLASVVANSVNILDMVLFAVLAAVVQMVVFLVGRKLLPGLIEGIQENNIAKATILAAISIAVGILNAAALTY